MHKYAQNMHQICSKNAQNIPLHRLQYAKYAENMKNYAWFSMNMHKKICRKYAENMQSMHESI